MNRSVPKIELDEKRFWSLLDKLPAGAYTCDAEGLITYYNPRAVELWGREPKLNDAGARYCGSFKLYSPDGAPLRHDQCWMALAIKNDREYNGREIVIERPDGSRLTALSHANPIHDEAGRLVGAANVLVDISRHKQVEESLRRSEANLRDFVENASEGLHWVGPDGIILWANQADLDMLGYTREEYIGRRIVEFHADPEVIEDFLVRLTRGETLREREARMIHKDGSIRHVLVNSNALFENGKFIHTRCFIRDITERKRAEAALRESEERFRVLADSAPVLIWVNSPTSCEFVNHECLEFLGVDEADVLGHEWAKFVHPEDREDYVNAYREAVSKRSRFEAEFRFRRRDGEYRWMRSVGIPRIEGGEFKGYVGSASDIHERKRGEEAIRAAYEQESAARAEAEAANRRKDEFLAVVSHELRLPLNAILGYNRTLRESLPDDVSLKQACDIIERNARTQLRLIEDLLDTARIASGKLKLEMSKMDINPVIAEAFDVVRHKAEARGVRLRIADRGSRVGEKNPQPAIVFGDAARLQQIVWNLLSNAIKFTPAGGQVELQVELGEGHIRIIVSDTGIGIRPEFLPYVFDRFRQGASSSSRQYGGLGLGLALAQHLAELHGGKIEAASEGEGRGATFTVTLPPATEGEPFAAEPPALAASAKLSDGAAGTNAGIPLPAGLTIAGARVLVVDAQEEARASLADFLGRSGAIVMTASSGAEALAILSNSPDAMRPDVLLCDIAMPGEDGYAALRRVRALEEARGVAASQRIPAIALTALAGKEERLRALNSGFQLHVPKPVDPVELILVIANIRGMGRRKAAIN